MKKIVVLDATLRGYTVIDNWIFQAPFSIHEKILYITLKRWAGYQASYPSITTLAQNCSMSERQVQRSITTLVKYKLLHVSYRAGNTSIYTLLDPLEFFQMMKWDASEHTPDYQSPPPDYQSPPPRLTVTTPPTDSQGKINNKINSKINTYNEGEAKNEKNKEENFNVFQYESEQARKNREEFFKLLKSLSSRMSPNI